MTTWNLLEECAHASLFSPARLTKQSELKACSITLDYSHQCLTDDTLSLLFQLADERQLSQRFASLMQGDKVNQSERRPALHTALRAQEDSSIWVDGHNVIPDVLAARGAMQTISATVREGSWLGYSGKPITDIVNIGIGGSDLGPRLCVSALADYQHPDLRFHFISDADPSRMKRLTMACQPDTTLFIISSKSFTTQETLYQAKLAMDWVGHPSDFAKHFIAITANPQKAISLGIDTVLPIWDWVGGRYSFFSAINLIAAIAIGFEQFEALLAGAHAMDKHCLTAPHDKNLPVLLALLGVWNNNFLGLHSLLTLTYTQLLEGFVPYLQQLDMESNGKSMDLDGKAVHYATGPMVWGGSGNQAQHSYYQLLCQGTHRMAIDFISLQSLDNQLVNDYCLNTINVLSDGIKGGDENAAFIPGNLPINHLLLEQMTPFCLGALVAAHEHKIFAQSVIWHINPFDQPGVESAKKLKAIKEKILSETNV